jgi:preprotein translocase subunit SecD
VWWKPPVAKRRGYGPLASFALNLGRDILMKNNIWLVLIVICAIASIFLIYNPRTHKSAIQLGLDLRSGSHITVQLLETKNPLTNDTVKITPEVQQQAIQIFQHRLNPDGTREIVITPEPPDRLIIEIPVMTYLAEAEAMVRQAARLEFKESHFDPQTNSVNWKTVMDGSLISKAWGQPASGGANAGWEVHFELTSEGTRTFGEITRRLVGQKLGIFFDGKNIQAPTVQTPITDGSGQITGLYGSGNVTAAQEATRLANFLNAGALPVDVKILESYTISPTLGAESLQHSLAAGLLGLGVVCLYMVGYYRLPGLMAAVALIIYSDFCLASMNIPGLQFVLTLPGIAGFVLSIGMAVDANVLIFERIKEELWAGKTLSKAIGLGFDRAWASIVDGHVTTGVGAFVLYYFGSASIKGFGLTLMVGTAWSMITAIFVTRTLIDFCLGTLHVKSRKAFGE